MIERCSSKNDEASSLPGDVEATHSSVLPLPLECLDDQTYLSASDRIDRAARIQHV